jgi:hypothetical protein
MTTRRVKPGQPLSIKAAEYNAILEAADAAAAGRFPGGKPRPIPETRSAGVIRIQNGHDSTVAIGQILGIDGSFFDPEGTDEERLQFARRPTMTGVEPTDDHAGRFAVAIEPITEGGHGQAIAAGLVAVVVDVVDADHRFAEAKAAGGVVNLVSGPTGSAQIVFRPNPAATGVQRCLVRLGNRTTSPPLVRFTLEAALAAGGTAAALINSDGPDDDEPITVTDWSGNGGLEGDKGIAFDSGGGLYYVAEIKNRAEAQIVRFTLEEDLDPFGNAGASINSTGPDDDESIDLEDWAGNGGKEGDKGVAWFSGGQYYVLEIKNRGGSPLVRFTLTEDLARARGSEAAADIEGEIVGAPITGTVANWGRHWAKSGARGTAFEITLSDETTYFVVDVEPVATRVRGRVAAAFSCSDSTVILDSIAGLNGDAPDDEVVANNFGMAAAEGAQARAEFNEQSGAWELTWVPVTPVVEVYVHGTAPTQSLRYKTTCTPVGDAGILIDEIGNACE